MQQRRSYAPENSECHSTASHSAARHSMSRCSTPVTVPLTPTVTTGTPVVVVVVAAAAGGWLPALTPGGCGVAVRPKAAGAGSPAHAA